LAPVSVGVKVTVGVEVTVAEMVILGIEVGTDAGLIAVGGVSPEDEQAAKALINIMITKILVVFMLFRVMKTLLERR
jgi:hypothetical protein